MYQRNTIKNRKINNALIGLEKRKLTLPTVKTLILSAIIGTLAGLIGVLFEKSRLAGSFI